MRGRSEGVPDAVISSASGYRSPARAEGRRLDDRPSEGCGKLSCTYNYIQIYKNAILKYEKMRMIVDKYGRKGKKAE